MVYLVTENVAIIDQDPEKLAGRRLRELRTARRWPLREVAQLMRQHGYTWHQSVVAKIETGQRPLRLNEAIALSNLFGVPLSCLLIDPAGPRDAEEIDALLKEKEALLARAESERQSIWADLHQVEASQSALQVELESAAGRVAFLQATIDALHRAQKQAGSESGPGAGG